MRPEFVNSILRVVVSIFLEKSIYHQFDDNDIKIYLNKKYGRLNFLNRRKKNLARAIVEMSPNLMVRPMLLSYIDDLVSPTDNITPVRYTYAYQIYEVLIDKWIQREANRVSTERRQEFIEDLYYFSNQVALRIRQNSRAEGGLFIKAADILPLARSFEINLDELELRGRSLLNRNIEGKFKFAHKSILEYFLAANAYHNRKMDKAFWDGQVKIVSSIDLEDFDQAKDFFVEMCLDFKKHPPIFDDLRYKEALLDTSGRREEMITKVLETKYKDYMAEWIDSRTLLLKRK